MVLELPYEELEGTCPVGLRQTLRMADSDNAQVERVFDKLAPRYDRSMLRCERFFLGHGREWASKLAQGEVLEIAVGTGLNLAHYPPSARVLGIDLSGAMVRVARDRIAAAGLADRVRVEVGDVQVLDLPDETFDTVVSTYTFCTIPDPASAAKEAFRILRPGGRFLLVEHGPSANRVICGAQKVLDPLFVRFQADHITRNPVPYVEGAGFQVGEVQRSRAGIVFRVVARKAA